MALKKGEIMKYIASLAVCLALLAPLSLAADNNLDAAETNTHFISSVLSGGSCTKALSSSNLDGIPALYDEEGGGCSAGGPGATKCSYGSCTVKEGECSEGKYACCGTDVCGCSGGTIMN